MKEVLNVFELMLGYYRSDPSADCGKRPCGAFCGRPREEPFDCLFSRLE